MSFRIKISGRGAYFFCAEDFLCSRYIIQNPQTIRTAPSIKEVVRSSGNIRPSPIRGSAKTKVARAKTQSEDGISLRFGCLSW